MIAAGMPVALASDYNSLHWASLWPATASLRKSNTYGSIEVFRVSQWVLLTSACHYYEISASHAMIGPIPTSTLMSTVVATA